MGDINIQLPGLPDDYLPNGYLSKMGALLSMIEQNASGLLIVNSTKGTDKDLLILPYDAVKVEEYGECNRHIRHDVSRAQNILCAFRAAIDHLKLAEAVSRRLFRGIEGIFFQ